MPEPNNRPSRRNILDRFIQACSAVCGVALAGPALMYLWPVTQTGPVKAREEVGDAAGWQPWTGRKVSIAGKPVLVVRTDSSFVALSAVCTHLGCLVEFNSAGRQVVCPCHAATFDLEGKVTGGPPPRPLATYNVAEVQGKVVVSL